MAASDYNVALTQMAKLVCTQNARTLRYYYELGALVNGVLNGDTAEYGAYTVAIMAADIRARTNLPMSKGTLYKAAKFQAFFPPEQLEELVAKQVSWRIAIKLCSGKVSPQLRCNLVRQVVDGHIAVDSIESELWRHVNSVAKGSCNPTGYKGMADVLLASANTYMQQLLQFGQTVTLLEPATCSPEIKREILRVRRMIRETQFRLEKALATIDVPKES